MLVYINKGLINIQPNFIEAVLDNGLVQDKQGISRFEIALAHRLDSISNGARPEMLLKYNISEQDEYKADFKLLKDCFLNACRQSNVSVFSNSDVVGYQVQQPSATNTINQIVNARYLHGEDTTTASEASNPQPIAREWLTAQVGQVSVLSSTNVTGSGAVISTHDHHVFNNTSSSTEEGDGEDYT